MTFVPIAGIIVNMMARAKYKLDLADTYAEIRFAAFDTGVQIRAYGTADTCTPALEQAYADCRRYEQLFSRTIPSSDISRINAAQSAWVEVNADTAELIDRALAYCAASHDVFDDRYRKQTLEPQGGHHPVCRGACRSNTTYRLARHAGQSLRRYDVRAPR